MVNTARVKLTLPKKGHCWFFVDLDTSVNDFKKQCLEEDEVIKEVEVLQGNAGKVVEDGQLMYSLLSERNSPLYLRLNNIHY